MSIPSVALPLSHANAHLSLPGNKPGKKIGNIGNDFGNASSPFTLSYSAAPLQSPEKISTPNTHCIPAIIPAIK